MVARARPQARASRSERGRRSVVMRGRPRLASGRRRPRRARLKERFQRPAFAFALNARTRPPARRARSPGVDLGRAVRARPSRPGWRSRAAGHAMAAGVTLRRGQAATAFRAFLRTPRRRGRRGRADRALSVDAVLTAGGARPSCSPASSRRARSAPVTPSRSSSSPAPADRSARGRAGAPQDPAEGRGRRDARRHRLPCVGQPLGQALAGRREARRFTRWARSRLDRWQGSRAYPAPHRRCRVPGRTRRSDAALERELLLRAGRCKARAAMMTAEPMNTAGPGMSPKTSQPSSTAQAICVYW